MIDTTSSQKDGGVTKDNKDDTVKKKLVDLDDFKIFSRNLGVKKPTLLPLEV